jgi:hypothetical protein
MMKMKVLTPRMYKEIEIKSSDLAMAVKQMEAAVKACGCTPLYYEICAKYEEESED